jgi:hypothetical protein
MLGWQGMFHTAHRGIAWLQRQPRDSRAEWLSRECQHEPCIVSVGRARSYLDQQANELSPAGIDATNRDRD